jgi:3-oxoacyl-[acyl-carrier-protein] synthase II
MANRVLITGIGVLSSVASGRELFWKGLEQGVTGFRPITLFDTTALRVRVGGEIPNFDAEPLLGKKGLRDFDRSTRLLCCAAKLALQDSRLEITAENANSVGVSIGATFGSLHSIAQFDRSCLLEGPRAVNPSHFPNTVINSPASQVSIRFKIKGFNTTLSTGYCASLDAVSYAADFIELGRAAAVLAGGVEELCLETFTGFHHLGALSGSDGSEPRCLPFDANRNGMILGEGATVLVLESEEHARSRNAVVLGRILGCANSFDPGDAGSSHGGSGLARAINEALQQASLNPGEIDCIFASANATRGLDRMETAVIKKVFGACAYSIPVTAVKSMIGETYSASGALAIAAATGAFHTGILPATAGYLTKDPECDLSYVHGSGLRKQVGNVLVTASDPSGQNAAVVIGR